MEKFYLVLLRNCIYHLLINLNFLYKNLFKFLIYLSETKFSSTFKSKTVNSGGILSFKAIAVGINKVVNDNISMRRRLIMMLH